MNICDLSDDVRRSAGPSGNDFLRKLAKHIAWNFASKLLDELLCPGKRSFRFLLAGGCVAVGVIKGSVDRLGNCGRRDFARLTAVADPLLEFLLTALPLN